MATVGSLLVYAHVMIPASCGLIVAVAPLVDAVDPLTGSTLQLRPVRLHPLTGCSAKAYATLKVDGVFSVYVTLFELEPSFTREKLLTGLEPTGNAGVMVNGKEVMAVGIAVFDMVIVAGKITALAVSPRS